MRKVIGVLLLALAAYVALNGVVNGWPLTLPVCFVLALPGAVLALGLEEPVVTCSVCGRAAPCPYHPPGVTRDPHVAELPRRGQMGL